MMKNSNQTIKSISDEKIVEFILRHLSEDEYEYIHQEIKNNNNLANRVKYWDELLSSLNENTLSITPRGSVWKKIEKAINNDLCRCNDIKSTNPHFIERLLSNLSQNFIKIGVPATLFAAIAWFGVINIISPSYHTNVYNQDGIAVWQTDIKKDRITFKSVRNVSLENKICIAWINSPTNGWVKLGKIPDTGKDRLKTLTIPNNYIPQVGDKVHVAMVDSRFSSELMPKTSMSLSVATLR